MRGCRVLEFVALFICIASGTRASAQDHGRGIVVPVAASSAARHSASFTAVADVLELSADSALVADRVIGGPGISEPSIFGGGARRQVEWISGLCTTMNSGRVDTVAKLALPARRRELPSIVTEFPGPRSAFVPFAVQDEWAEDIDGAIAVVWGSDYHVEWTLPTGKQVAGAPIPYRPVPVDASEKADYFRRALRDSVIDYDCSSRPCKVTAVHKDRPSDEFPPFKNPFVERSLRFDAKGNLWIERARASTDSIARYDVVGRDGTFRATIQLPPGRQVAAAGPWHLFLVWTDEDDLQYVERYPLPALR